MTEPFVQPSVQLNQRAFVLGLRTKDLALAGMVTALIVAGSSGEYIFLGLLSGAATLAALSVVRSNNRERFLRDTLVFLMPRRSIYDRLSKTS